MAVEYLGQKLARDYNIHLISDKKNWALRVGDVVFYLLKYRKRCSLVLIDTYSTWNFYYAFIAGALAYTFNLPYILLLNGGNLPKRLKQSPKLSNWLLSIASKLIVQSGYLKTAFEKRGYDSLIISNFIEVKDYPFKKRNNLTLDIIWVRAYQAIYNPEMAVEVVAYLKQAYSNLNLTMIGPDKDGSFNKVDQMVKAKGLEEYITLKSRLTKPEWIDLSKKYSIFINTTNFDNLPISVLEAMALGFPIVSTDAGGLPYLIDHEENGLLVEKDDHEEMAQQIERLVQNPELTNKLSTNARQKAESFNWANVKPQWDALLKNFLDHI